MLYRDSYDSGLHFKNTFKFKLKYYNTQKIAYLVANSCGTTGSRTAEGSFAGKSSAVHVPTPSLTSPTTSSVRRVLSKTTDSGSHSPGMELRREAVKRYWGRGQRLLQRAAMRRCRACID